MTMTEIHSCSYFCDRPECIKAQRDELRERLAQPEQEPVFDCPRCGHCCPQRKPLTDEQIDRLWSQSLADTEGETYLPLREFARAIEAAHGIKENT